MKYIGNLVIRRLYPRYIGPVSIVEARSGLCWRGFSTDGEKPPENWRKKQLRELEERVSGEGGTRGEDGGEEKVEVQQMWKDMESRVTRRRVRTLEEAGVKVGRRNVRRTDEDEWLEAGVYWERGGKEGGGEGEGKT